MMEILLIGAGICVAVLSYLAGCKVGEVITEATTKEGEDC
jgi:hypothetical protein